MPECALPAPGVSALSAGVAARRHRLEAEEAGARGPAADLFFRRIPHGIDGQVQPQRDAGQRMVAVEHQVVGIDLRHRVEHVLGHVGIDAGGQGCAVEGHAFFHFLREQRTRLQEQQVLVEVAESLFRLQVQLHARAGAMALQGGLDGVEEVVAAHQEFDGLGQHVQGFAKGVLQGPGQGDHALGGDFHMRILPPCP